MEAAACMYGPGQGIDSTEWTSQLQFAFRFQPPLYGDHNISDLHEYVIVASKKRLIETIHTPSPLPAMLKD